MKISRKNAGQIVGKGFRSDAKLIMALIPTLAVAVLLAAAGSYWLPGSVNAALATLSTVGGVGSASTAADVQAITKPLMIVAVTVTPASTPTATDNDYTRINNAVQAAPSGETITLSGTFDWAEPFAAASWALGSNGVAGDIDDYSIYVPANRNNITFTANALGDATIQGPGDLPVYDFEAVFFFDGGDNQNWTISNIRFVDFDNAIGMFKGAGGDDAFNGTKIINNYIKVPQDLNGTVAPADFGENLAIHYSLGTNQMISGNTIEFAGDGVSDSANLEYSIEVGLQSNATGGNFYDGLQITNNVFRVLNAQAADPEIILGIWENGQSHNSNITVSGNSFTNLAGGNNPAANLQRGFRVTSHSSLTTTVKYENNTVSGANIGFQWLSGVNLGGNQPVQLISNTITGNNIGVLIQSGGSATLKFNRFVGNLAAGLSVANTTAVAINAENNWWGCNYGPGVGGPNCTGTPNGIINTSPGTVDANPWLVLGLTAAPNPLPMGGSANLTASLKMNSDGVDTSLMGMGLFPDGVTTSFTATLGTVAPMSAPTSGGMAMSVYTNTASGTATITATVDQQTVILSLPEATCPAISLIPTSLPSGTPGVAYSQTISATPEGGNYSFALTSGMLPSGITLAPNGTLAGTPTQSGTFNFRVTATDSGGCTGFRDYQLTIGGCPTVTLNPASLPGGTVGTAYNQTVTASPAGTYNYAVTSGALPLGLTLNAANGEITGTPTTNGTFAFTITATSGSCSGSRSYSIAIGCAGVSFTTTSLPPGNAGVFYSQTLNVTPAGSYTFSLTSGNLPSGLTLHPTTGVISGTPSTTSTSTFTVKAQSTSGCNATQTYTLVIGCPTITVNPATLPSGTVGTAYSQTITALPVGGNYTYAVSGTLPTGFNLNPSTGVLSGTPTANGVFTFTITATGWGSCTGSRSYTVTIGGGGCPTITLPGSLPNGTVGQLYNRTVSASPSGNYSYTASGILPPGVILYGSIGLLFGYPTTPGSYTFTITATAGACSGSKTYTVLIGTAFASSLTVFSDFDGDGKSDLSVFRGTDGNWLVANSGDGQLQSTAWGASYAPYNDVTVSGDYDGDGKTDLAVFRRGGAQAGYWYIKQSSDGQVKSHFWGLGTDVPVPGDYDGDGKTDVAVWRGSAGAWYILRSSDGGIDSITWGYAPVGDIPAPGDYDGDSKTDIAVFRQSSGFWYIRRSSDALTISAEWGIGTDVPVPGDYDGDGRTDLAVWRGSESNWYIIESGSALLKTLSLGAAALGDVPAVADYDGDGKADPAIWRASTGIWTVKQSRDGLEMSKTLGQSGDVPIMARRN